MDGRTVDDNTVLKARGGRIANEEEYIDKSNQADFARPPTAVY